MGSGWISFPSWALRKPQCIYLGTTLIEATSLFTHKCALFRCHSSIILYALEKCILHHSADSSNESCASCFCINFFLTLHPLSLSAFYELFLVLHISLIFTAFKWSLRLCFGFSFKHILHQHSYWDLIASSFMHRYSLSPTPYFGEGHMEFNHLK